MKKTFLFLLGISAALIASADVRVLSDVKLGEGFFPRFTDQETVVYLASSNADYREVEEQVSTLHVDNENLDLNLYRNGERIVLKPHGDVNYIWSSLSPDQTMILFNTKYGTGICDLNGKEIINLNQIAAPVWYGNEFVVGMNEMHDGYNNTASFIMIASVDGKVFQRLTAPEGFGMYPNVDAKSGRIVYNTEDGEIRLLQLNLTEEPIRKELPRLVKELDGRLLNDMKRQAKRASSANPADYKIYINPGHGGYGSNDRLMYLYPIFKDVGNSNLNESGQYTREQSFWESVSNLDKGLRLDTMLRDLGFQTKMSRVTNNDGGYGDIDVLNAWLKAGSITQAEYDYMLANGDDRSLSAISAEASEWNADFMLSIHSNAGNPSNYILHLHSGITPGDPYGLNGYPEKVPEEICNEARAITTLMGQNQYSNQVSCWSREPNIAGDKTFARTIMGWSNGYGVMRNLKVPGTISEGMMHDYLPETYRLMNIDYKRQESFQFAKTFIQHFCNGELPYGAIGGKLHDVYLKQEFPNYKARKGTRDEYRPILKGVVELWQNDQLLQTYVTDTLYNGVYYFWNLQPGTYTVKAKPAGYYPQEQILEVKKHEISYGIFAMSLMRQIPPEVIAYTPKVELTDSVKVSTQVTISFNWDMEIEATASAFSVSPAVEGTITFEDDNHTLRFKPASRFEPGVEYTVTLGTGACHPDTTFDNHLKEPFSFKFRTADRGSVRLIQTYPTNGLEDVPLDAAFIAIFDAKLTNASNKYFKVYDAAGNDISPASRNVKINGVAPAPYGSARFELKAGALQPNSEYKMVIGAEVSDVDGVLVNDPVTVTFKTGDEVTSFLPICNNLDTLFFEGDKETSVGVTSVSTLRNTASKYEGLASNELTYTFSDANGEAVYAVDDVTAIKCNSQSILGMHVSADYSFNTLYAKWAVDGDIQYTKICDLDYAGWLYQEADMSALPAGVDYQFMGFKLVRQSSFLSEKGEVSVDALRVQYSSTAVEDVHSPATNLQKRIENGYLHILLNGIKYNAQGAVVE